MTEKTKPLDLEDKNERVKLASDIIDIWFFEYLKTYYSDEDLKDVRNELKEIRLEMRDFALFCIERFVKQRIKQAVAFYERYKDKPELLVKEYPELKGELRRFGLDVNIIESISSKDSEVWVLAKSYTAFKHFDKEKYQEWLFKLAFKSVLGEKNG